MNFLSKLFGGGEDERSRQAPVRRGAPQAAMSEDERALARYRYMLQTAPPDTLEQAHAEAFAQLTPEQRKMVLNDLSAEAPEYERGQYTDDPQSLGRLATRVEQRNPGTLERSFGRMGGPGGPGGGMGMPGMGSMMAGSFLSTIAGVMVGSAIANAFFGDMGIPEGMAPEEVGDVGAADTGGDAGFGDTGAEMGGDAGDLGGFGDFGGGDFGGEF